MINVTLHIPDGEIEAVLQHYMPTVQKMELVGGFMHNQVKDRFKSQGASGGQPWPSPKWRESIGAPDGRALLTGPSTNLQEKWFSYGEEDSAVVFSSTKYSYVHEEGTLGKGGKLPDIKAKPGKALFIPLTEAAESSEKQGGIRVPTRGRKLRNMPGVFAPLVKGRLKDGRLQKWEDGEWVDGRPDFLLLKKVSIPPRPMLPTSPQEVQESVDFAREVLFDRET